MTNSTDQQENQSRSDDSGDFVSPRIPRHYHFIFGLKPQTEAFHLAWYLCLRSCLHVNRPDRITLYYHYEPHGEWWERIKPELELVQVEQEETITGTSFYQNHQEGRFILEHDLGYAHQSDFIRLRALIEHGGIYVDIDTLFVRPYPDDFFTRRCVMGREDSGSADETLCNAVILAEKNSMFVRTWLDQMSEVFDGSWNRHSCIEPALLSRRIPEYIYTVQPVNFFHFPVTSGGLADLFGRVTELPEDLYSIHMWSHLWWSHERTDFARFHNGMLTEEFIRTVDTTYNLIARQYLD